MALKLRKWLEKPAFMKRFVAKGRFEEFLKTLPVRLITPDDNALLGLAWHSLITAKI